MRGRNDAGNGSGNVGADNSKIMNYLSLKVKESDIEVDILQFWQKHEKHYPFLSQLVNLYLGMSSS